MKFNVTYWEHRQLAGVASGEEVTQALREYVKGDPGESHAGRARIVLTQLFCGFTPDDMGIIALALREAGFEAESREPESTDENTDYTAELYAG